MFSRRLPWTDTGGLNPLARKEVERRAAGGAILDLTVTNPTLVGLPYPEEELIEALAALDGIAYHPAPLGLPSAREAVAADYARRGAKVDPEALVLTASSSESYSLLFKLLADPGDAVLVPQPSYPLFDHLARLEGVEPRPYRLAHEGPPSAARWLVDWDSVAWEGARAFCLVSPNNPTGSLLTSPDFERAAALAAERGLALIVDEVFADYAFSPGPEAVLGVAGRPVPALTFCLGGLSKGAGLPQLKLGWIATGGPPALVLQALTRLDLLCDAYLSVGTPVQRALPRLLSLGSRIRESIGRRVVENRRALAAALAGTPATLWPAEGGWSALVQLPAVATDEEWALSLLDDGVLVQPGYFFDLDLEATLVLSLLTPPEVFTEGVRRLLARARSLP